MDTFPFLTKSLLTVSCYFLSIDIKRCCLSGIRNKKFHLEDKVKDSPVHFMTLQSKNMVDFYKTFKIRVKKERVKESVKYYCQVALFGKRMIIVNDT